MSITSEEIKEMDIVEFLEEGLGLNLLEYQKQWLRIWAVTPKDAVLVTGRFGTAYWVPKIPKEAYINDSSNSGGKMC